MRKHRQGVLYTLPWLAPQLEQRKTVSLMSSLQKGSGTSGPQPLELSIPHDSSVRMPNPCRHWHYPDQPPMLLPSTGIQSLEIDS